MKKFISGFIVGAMVCVIVSVYAATTYVANPLSYKVLVNGKDFTSDPPPVEIEGRTYLPLRAMGEALGVPVNWNETLRQAEVGTAPSPQSLSYSRNNPAPLNTMQSYTSVSKYSEEDNYTVNVRILETVRGEKAYSDLVEQKLFFPEPTDGYEYINVKVAFSVFSTKGDFSVTPYVSDFTSFTSNNEECPSVPYVSLTPDLSGSLYSGGNKEGWITVMVKKDDASPKLAYGLDYNGANGIWFKLQ